MCTQCIVRCRELTICSFMPLHDLIVFIDVYFFAYFIRLWMCYNRVGYWLICLEHYLNFPYFSGVTCMAYLPSGNLLVACKDSIARIFDQSTRKCLSALHSKLAFSFFDFVDVL